MKKFAVLSLAIITLLLCSCIQQTEPSPAIETSTGASTTTEIPIPIITPDQLPRPDEIKVNFDTVREDGWEYRSVYHGISGAIGELHQKSRYKSSWQEGVEMEMVAYLRDYNVRKEDFLAAVQKNYENRMDFAQFDIYHEYWELPNADIIYTFDNEVINAYYRLVNPVEPDWTKTKTYESYAAYLEENPQ